MSMESDPLLDDFIRHLRVERGLAPNTCLSYGYQLGVYVAFLRNRDKGPAEATREDVLAFLEARKGDGLKSASLFIAAMAVRQFHRHLAQTGGISADPTVGMRLPRFKQRVPEPLDAEDMDRLLRPPVGAKFSAVRDAAMLETMYSTGMRVSELTGLRLGQVDLVDGWVRILGKGSRERIVPIGPRAAQALEHYLAARAVKFPAAGDAIFLNARGRGLTRSGFGGRLAAAARRTGILGRLTPHQIRHTTATVMLEGGASLRVVQEMLGHRSVLTTQRYTHVSSKFMKKTLQAVHPRF